MLPIPMKKAAKKCLKIYLIHLRVERSIRFSQEKIKAAGHPAMTIMVVTEMGEAKDISFLTGNQVDANASVIANL